MAVLRELVFFANQNALHTLSIVKRVSQTSEVYVPYLFPIHPVSSYILHFIL